jgi:hypothetical protein
MKKEYGITINGTQDGYEIFEVATGACINDGFKTEQAAQSYGDEHYPSTEQYRFDHAYDSVYEYSNEQQAYVLIGKMNGRTEEEFVNDYEERQAHAE